MSVRSERGIEISMALCMAFNTLWKTLFLSIDLSIMMTLVLQFWVSMHVMDCSEVHLSRVCLVRVGVCAAGDR